MLTPFGKRPSGERLQRILSTPTFRKGQFHNLSHTPMMAEDASYGEVFRNYLRPVPLRTPPAPLPVVQTDLHLLQGNVPEIVWFGHSSYLIHFQGKRILVDPVFSGHASPVSFMVSAFKGTNLYGVAEMPEIDVLLITHDHYDHLDHKTVVALRHKVKHVVCSLGVGAHLVHWGYDPGRIHELYWGEDTEPFAGIHFTAVPARHFSGRGLIRNQSLWSAFVLEWDGVRLYLGGDSGYDTHFAETGKQYNGFDVVILECGQYNPAWKYIHMMPEQTVQAAWDLGAKILLPVHWAKFKLSLHTWNEPAVRALQAARQTGMPMALPPIGAVFQLGKTDFAEPWWE